jgi:redox-sensitive bicupin YhaK (pirin superfamily)
MITVIKSKDRHYVDVKDQKTWETFDAENKPGPFQMSFGVLKILNEEILSPGGGFVLHAKKDMVVVTYVREGVIIYKAPSEEPAILETKEFGRNNAAKDTSQYAFNTSEYEEAHVFQCAFDLDECADSCEEGSPKPKGVKKLFTHAEREGVLRLIASSDGMEGSLAIKQDVQIYSAFTRDGNHIIHQLKPGRSAWLHVVKGEISHNGLHLRTGDGAGLTEERSVSFTSKCPTEILIFDLCESKDEKKETSKNKKQAVEAR